jgi:glycyl-tRNA synthetase beta chain
MKASPRNATQGKGDLLFEIGCEEIPAGMILKASQELKVILEKHLAANRLVNEPTAHGGVETFGAPRRLTAIARGLRLKQEDIVREITGPPKAVAYVNGEPTRAAESFASKQGVALSKLTIVSTPKGEYVAIQQVVPGQPARKILAGVLPEVIQEISWPRSMYWTGAQGPRFIRPVRWIVALLDGEIVSTSFAGVSAGSRTDGHRFLGRSGVQVHGPEDYEEKLKKNFVLCRPEARRKKIESELHGIVARHGFRARRDATLLDLVTYLNEYPTAIMGAY